MLSSDFLISQSTSSAGPVHKGFLPFANAMPILLYLGLYKYWCGIHLPFQYADFQAAGRFIYAYHRKVKRAPRNSQEQQLSVLDLRRLCGGMCLHRPDVSCGCVACNEGKDFHSRSFAKALAN